MKYVLIRKPEPGDNPVNQFEWEFDGYEPGSAPSCAYGRIDFLAMAKEIEKMPGDRFRLFVSPVHVPAGLVKDLPAPKYRIETL